MALRSIYCVGRNYAEHAKELGNAPSRTPIIFMKPASAVIGEGGTVVIPQGVGSCHHEIELALQIGADLRRASPAAAMAAVSGYAVALDMTLRDLQETLKKAGHPWDRAKAFETALPLSAFRPAAAVGDPATLQLHLERNGKSVQQGRTADMILSVPELVAFVSEHFQLRAGDVILTGTPAGVGPVLPGDELLARIDRVGELRVRVTGEA